MIVGKPWNDQRIIPLCLALEQAQGAHERRLEPIHQEVILSLRPHRE
jgi:hypothetical protein